MPVGHREARCADEYSEDDPGDAGSEMSEPCGDGVLARRDILGIVAGKVAPQARRPLPPRAC